MMPFAITDAGTLLLAALRRSAAAAGAPITVADDSQSPWASLTFTGRRHRVALIGADDAAFRTWLDRLAAAELPMRGHVALEPQVVARVVTAGGLEATLEVVTIEDS